MKTILIAGIYVVAPLVIILLYQRFRIISKIGTVILAYAVGILMALSGLMDVPQDQTKLLGTVQEWFMNLAVPIAIPLMLFSSHFTLWFKTLGKTITTLLAGIISVLLTITAAYFVFRGAGLPDLWKTSGMLVGMYTGGTLNFAALSRILDVDNDTYILVQTFDTVLGFILLLFIIGGGYKLFRKILPASPTTQRQAAPLDKASSDTVSTEVTSESFENYSGMLRKGTRGRLFGALLLSIACLGIGAGISLAVGMGLNELIIILTITTLAIAASFIPSIRSIPKTFELGMFFILVFSVVVASLFDIHSLFNRESLNTLAMVGFVLVGSVLLHLFFARIFKIEGDLFTVSHIALLFSPPFVPPVAAAMKNKGVLVSGIIIGLMGYACGTYLGTIMAQLFHWIN